MKSLPALFFNTHPCPNLRRTSHKYITTIDHSHPGQSMDHTILDFLLLKTVKININYQRRRK